ncbi:hypothetical protein J1605_013459 [Eschrichtius robustus]|uniref:Uncharacterized protein n=1 Tax=Eschrichtius robustus TaxID=9764 RepID=A0AB34GHM1_ESCRO|nr:hypothetical protein J1605_013459 [Eschrichtius robustus]
MEKLVDSSCSWSIYHLLRFSRLLPKEDADASLDVYYVLPHAMRLLRGMGDQSIMEALKDVCNFTLLHGISLSDVTKEDFAIVIETLLDTTELISDQPGILSEALTCLPVFWCLNHTTSGFQQNPRSGACYAHKLTSPSFYSKVASILDHRHLSSPGEDSQCWNESSQVEITRKVACVIHELMDWNSILLELSKVFHVKTLLVKTVQEFWHKKNSGDKISLLLKDFHKDVIAEMRARAGGESRALDPLSEMSRTLTMLVDDGAEMRGLATSVTSTVHLLKLAEKTSREVAAMFEMPFVFTANNTMKFLDTLYSILQQSV